MPTSDKSAQRVRREIAMLAAKMIAEDGVIDYLAAKRKAALRLGIKSDRGMPSNQEIEDALVDYQRLFQGDDQPAALAALRRTALEAMQFLAGFSPRLVGPVLAGTATRHSEVVLHLFADQAEDVAIFLYERGVPCTHTERAIKIGPGEIVDFPAYRFLADQTPVVLIVFGENRRNLKPLSPIDGRPMQRAALREVEALLNKPA